MASWNLNATLELWKKNETWFCKDYISQQVNYSFFFGIFYSFT